MHIALLALLLAGLTAEKLPLPSGAPTSMDYLDVGRGQVWIPAGGAGAVFVLERSSGTFRKIDGFATRKGRGDRLMGPSSVSLGDGLAYVGNRGDSSVCAFDTKTLEKKACAILSSSPDGTFYVATTQQVWVTTPHEKSLQILDAKDGLKLVGKIELDGEPEGYAVDAERGLVYTNLEDKDRTLVIDARTRAIVAHFSPGCGEAGPRGLAVDGARGLLLVACTDGIASFDAKSGARKGWLDTGAGVDNIGYAIAKRRLLVAAGKASRLSAIDVSDTGQLTLFGTAEVGPGSRVVVAGEDGAGYVADSAGGRLWVISSF